MCGIAGIIYNNRKSDKERMEKMLQTIAHRGPDDSGVYEKDNVTLGHVRLSIIDLKSGKQPMKDVSENNIIVFNGEIYGFKEIKKGLLGYPFKTNCDTEVILALKNIFVEPQEMLAHLPGMFSFAIWDEKEKSLFCARDRFGEKPFYYALSDDGDFIFASEIKAILASGLVSPRISCKALGDFVKHSYICPTTTVYENIWTLPPAHYLTYCNGNISVQQYWTLPKTDNSISLSDAADCFNELFSQAVRRQLVADVPVGAFLSGGLDSGSVVAQMAQLVPKVTTISFASTMGYDESPIAKSMADRYGTDHIVVHDSNVDITERLFRMQRIFDEPFGDPAAISAYEIAAEARKHVKVILSGDAGDEIMGGYARSYRKMLYAKQMHDSSIPVEMYNIIYMLSYYYQLVVRKIGFIRGNDISQTILHGKKINDTYIRRTAIAIAHNYPSESAAFFRKSNMNFVEDDDLLKMGLELPSSERYITHGLLGGENLDDLVRCDVLDYLPGNGLLKTDRTTMAVSLESRTPFCDIDLAEFCISLPFSLKVDNKTDKIILRKAMEKMWTPELKGVIKTGFTPPWDKWIVSREVKNLLHDYFYVKNARIWDYLDYNETVRYFDSCIGWPKWNLLNLSLWFATRTS